MLTLRTLVKLPCYQRYAYLKRHQVPDGCHFAGETCGILLLQWWSWPVCSGHTVGLDSGSVAQKSTEFLQHTLKNAVSSAELRGEDVDSLAVEPIQVSKALKMQHRTHRAHGRMNPHVSSPCLTERILLKKSRLSLNQEGRLH